MFKVVLLQLLIPAVSVPRLLAVRLALNPFSSYLSQRDWKPRRYVYNKGLGRDLLLGLTPSFIAARVLRFRKFVEKNKRLLAV